jgi:hypothetical protein
MVWDEEFNRVYKVPLSTMTVEASTEWHSVYECRSARRTGGIPAPPVPQSPMTPTGEGPAGHPLPAATPVTAAGSDRWTSSR